MNNGHEDIDDENKHQLTPNNQ